MRSVLRQQIIKIKYSYKIILVMIGLTLLMTFLFSDINKNESNISFGIVLEEKNEFSISVANEIKKLENIKFEILNEDLAYEKLNSSELIGYIIIPKDLDKKLYKSEEISLIMVLDKMDIEINFLKQHIMSVLSNKKNKKTSIDQIYNFFDKEISKEKVKETYQSNLSREKYIVIDEKKLKTNNEKSNVNTKTIGFVIFFVAYSILYNLAEILEDIEKKRFNRFLVTPWSKFKIIFSNLLNGFFIGLIQSLVALTLSDILLKTTYLDYFFPLLITLIAFNFALIGIGFVLVSKLKTYKQINAFTPVLLTSFGMLGGCFWPLEIVKMKALIYLSYITPHRWALLAINKIYSNFGIKSVIIELLVLAAIGCIGTFIGILGFKKREFF